MAGDPRDLIHVPDPARGPDVTTFGPSGRERFVRTRCGSLVPLICTTRGGLKATCAICDPVKVAGGFDPASGPDDSGLVINLGVDVRPLVEGFEAARRAVFQAFGIPPDELDGEKGGG